MTSLEPTLKNGEKAQKAVCHPLLFGEVRLHNKKAYSGAWLMSDSVLQDFFEAM